MFAVTAVVMDEAGRPVPLSLVAKARSICSLDRMGVKTSTIERTGIRRDPCYATIATVAGRRLTCAGSQLVGVLSAAGGLCWKRAWGVVPGVKVLALDGGILCVDRVTCVVLADQGGGPWVTVETEAGNVFAEGILCRAT